VGGTSKKIQLPERGFIELLKQIQFSLKKIKSKGQQYSVFTKTPTSFPAYLFFAPLELSEWGGGEEVRPWERDC